MSIQADCQKAVLVLQQLQDQLAANGDRSLDTELARVRATLESPLFLQLLSVQDSLDRLKEAARNRSLKPEHFEILPLSGALVFADQQVDRKRDSQPAGSTASGKHGSAGSVASQHGDAGSAPSAGGGHHDRARRHSSIDDRRKAVEALARGRAVETIQLYKAENTSLGFSVVGLKNENRGELGIYVQEVQVSGVAAQDGRLQEGDQLLAIDGHILDSHISHKQAVSLLQQALGLVEIVVARGPPVAQQQQSQQQAHSPDSTPTGSPTDTPFRGSSRHYSSSPPLGTSPYKWTTGDNSGADMLNSEWAQVEVIELLNDGTGLGFGIIGGKSTGVVVKTILPGGVADRDGRLQGGDHVLQIGDVNVRGLGSEQVATVLRQAGSRVVLIVARPIDDPDLAQVGASSDAPIMLTERLDDFLESLKLSKQLQSPVGQAGSSELQSSSLPLPEAFDVEIVKDAQGLGIMVAGYVGEGASPSSSADGGWESEPSGIFVKSIAPGGAAERTGLIRIDDQVVEVDGRSLHGCSNQQAVAALRDTGQRVRLRLMRHHQGWPRWRQNLAVSLSSGIDISDGPSRQSLDQLRSQDDAMASQNQQAGEPEMTAEAESALKRQWQAIVGENHLVIVAQLSKFSEGGGLGISLEGTVEVEKGVETKPHHYIGSILPDGPVGRNGLLRSGDELLEVNGHRLYGLSHKEVVATLKELPMHVCVVCSRLRSTDASAAAAGSSDPGGGGKVAPPGYSVQTRAPGAAAAASNTVASLTLAQPAPAQSAPVAKARLDGDIVEPGSRLR